MTQEEKATRYDEAIEKAKAWCDCEHATTDDKILLKRIFSELKEESEDERIRKALMQNLKERFGTKGNMGEGLDMPDVLAWFEKQGEQKPAWSEEEEVKINRIVACLENLNVADNDILLKDVDWLKSLKERVQPKPKQEWSEEDDKKRKSLIKGLEDRMGFGWASDPFSREEYIDWLKSLRPQNTWKPSNEQMLAIDTAINVIGKGTLSGKQLIELQEQLKKLREE